MSEPVKGEWLKDPTGHHEYRYFDGMVWTQHVADGGRRDVDLQPVPFAGALASPGMAERRWEIDPVGFALALLGATAGLVAVFLPRVESSSFATIERNTLIQSGDGYVVIAFALALAAAAYRAWASGKRAMAPFLFGALLLGVAIYDGTNKDALTLTRLSPTGGNLGDPVTASPAIGIYLAGVGGALGLLGAWRMWRDSSEGSAPRSPMRRANE